MGAFEWFIWLQCSLESSENHGFSDGFSLTGLLELVLYGSVVLGCSTGVELVSCLEFRGVRWCSTVLPVFRVPAYVVLQYAV